MHGKWEKANSSTDGGHWIKIQVKCLANIKQRNFIAEIKLCCSFTAVLTAARPLARSQTRIRYEQAQSHRPFEEVNN